MVEKESDGYGVDERTDNTQWGWWVLKLRNVKPGAK